jgi:hypothetical protein
VLVSDGQIGSDTELLRRLHDPLAGVQVFVIGVDQAPNVGFLERLARAAGGRCELVEAAERLEHVLESLHQRLHAPLLTALRLEPQQLTIIPETVTPARVPVCFAAAPFVIVGRYRGQPRRGLTITATDGTGRPGTRTVTGTVVPNAALAATWARAHLLDLEDRLDAGIGDRAGLTRHIIDTSLRFHVLCRFTAYVAVDHAEGTSVLRISRNRPPSRASRCRTWQNTAADATQAQPNPQALADLVRAVLCPPCPKGPFRAFVDPSAWLPNVAPMARHGAGHRGPTPPATGRAPRDGGHD